jgi:hypothetical protein
MTTPVHNESAVGAAVATPNENDSVAAASSVQSPSSIRKVNLVLGEWIAQGGFCSIWDVKSIQDLSTQDFLLGFPEPKDQLKEGNGRNSFSFRMKKGSSNHAPAQPVIISVQMTVVSPFNQFAAAPVTSSMGDSTRRMEFNSRTSNSSIFRRSTTTSDVPPSVHPSFLKRSTSKDQNTLKRTGTNNSINHTNSKETAAQFVLKCLKNQVLQNPDILQLGLKDMRVEIEMLQRLQHPNIIGLRAYGTMELDTTLVEESLNDNDAAQDPGKSNKPRILDRTSPAPTVFPFVVLDRLGETLEDKFKYWEAKHQKKSTFVGKLVTHRNHHKLLFCGRERWQILCDMASALAYLHRRRYAHFVYKMEYPRGHVPDGIMLVVWLW